MGKQFYVYLPIILSNVRLSWFFCKQHEIAFDDPTMLVQPLTMSKDDPQSPTQTASGTEGKNYALSTDTARIRALIDTLRNGDKAETYSDLELLTACGYPPSEWGRVQPILNRFLRVGGEARDLVGVAIFPSASKQVKNADDPRWWGHGIERKDDGMAFTSTNDGADKANNATASSRIIPQELDDILDEISRRWIRTAKGQTLMRLFRQMLAKHLHKLDAEKHSTLGAERGSTNETYKQLLIDMKKRQ